MTRQELAESVRKQFTKSTREDQSEYWHRKDNADDWVQEMCMEAHGEMFPDDWRYEMIVDALDILADEEDEDSFSERIDGDISVYNNNNARPVACGGMGCLPRIPAAGV
jgi:hypothetical protein